MWIKMVFTFKKLCISDIILIESKTYFDNRGFFYEGYKESDFILNGISDKFVQENFSHSNKNVIRGLHFQQNPKAQSKLISVIKGEIFDVAVDIRKNSPTYGQWIGEILSEENNKSLYLPEGFAHGFCVLSEYADVVYNVNKEFSSENDRGIIWNDPSINISWPIKEPILSVKDKNLPPLEKSDNNFIY